jgi:uncharacterized UBP type Zn finger protein
MAVCSHLDQIQVRDVPDEVPGCEECLKTGDRWVHLRQCLVCGKIGCCDNSPNHHATAHFEETGHPLIQSAEKSEEWSWCYLDERMFVLSRVEEDT